jgi:hypothetical protein
MLLGASASTQKADLPRVSDDGLNLFEGTKAAAVYVDENLGLPQQLIVLQRNQACPSLKVRDRVFWKVLSQVCPRWRDSPDHYLRGSVVSRISQCSFVGAGKLWE